MLSANRPIVTLFMLMSVDGKISPGASDELDYDKNFPGIPGLREGLQQYYDIEQTTDLWSFNSGRVMAKVGCNVNHMPEKTVVSFVVMDNSHLNYHGVKYFCAKSKTFVLVTSNPKHIAFSVKDESNLNIILQKSNFIKPILEELKSRFNCRKLTLQTGGTINGLFLREKLIDYLDIVVAPVLVGGKNTATLIDGDSLTRVDDLSSLGVLKLISFIPLESSYLRLRYKVISQYSDKNSGTPNNWECQIMFFFLLYI